LERARREAVWAAEIERADGAGRDREGADGAGVAVVKDSQRLTR
jgi:hypothetical protein